MLSEREVKKSDFVKGISNEINVGDFWFSKDMDIDIQNPFIVPSFKFFRETGSDYNEDFDNMISSTIYNGQHVSVNSLLGKILYKSTTWGVLHTVSGVQYTLGVFGDTDKSSGTEVGKLYYASNTRAGLYTQGGSWDDTWQTFETSNLGARVPIQKFLKYICFGNKNYLATWDIGNSVWNATRLTLPLGYNITWIKAKRDYLVIGCHHELNGSAVVLWDGNSTTYNSFIPLGNIKSFGADVYNDTLYTVTSDGWISRLAENTYLEKESRLPDYTDSEFLAFTICPDAIKFYQGLLLIGNNGWSTLIKRYMFGGIWAFNPLNKSLYLKHSISSGECINKTITSILSNDLTNKDLRIAWTTGTVNTIDILSNSGSLNVISEGAILVTEQIDGGEPAIGKRFKKFIVNFIKQLTDSVESKVIVRYNTSEAYNKKVVTCVSGSTNYFVLGGVSALDVNVGDEVTIVNGAGAGQIRNITAKEASGANWKFTVDSALSSSYEYSSATTIMIAEFFKIEPEILGSENIDATHRILRFMKRARKIQFKIEVCNPTGQTTPKVGIANWTATFVPDVRLK